jgi:hypothetical protein
LITGAGNAQASGMVGSANAINQGISGATNAYYQNQLLNTLGNRDYGFSDSQAQRFMGEY